VLHKEFSIILPITPTGWREVEVEGVEVLLHMRCLEKSPEMVPSELGDETTPLQPADELC